ncbi:TetR/AcrR family transcriptional regulator [Nocardia otitidiscaviarum]|uniref:TetR/AcrR family transcriptional regulator n=1 Tax=Nocardia otitidiscaviarum TaxID=1823 RepID=UPI0018961946|nr:TetR/AcrR family transcriptional regulator [Nocardia otitidiscaviarum]MBF6133958.1 TetR/AcrR family transcriptional regulator [Nocardia otitidiscaviarum]
MAKWGDRDARRRDILDAGHALLIEHGFGALQMRDVAKGAGISPGTVYTYFATKEALYAALYAQRLHEFADAIEPVCAVADDAENLYVAVATEYLEVYRVYGRELNLWSVLAGEVDLDPEVGGVLAAAAGRVLAVTRQAVVRLSGHDAPEDEFGPALVLLWSSINGLADHFTSVRPYLHAYGWEELVRFAARTLAVGLAGVAAERVVEEKR